MLKDNSGRDLYFISIKEWRCSQWKKFNKVVEGHTFGLGHHDLLTLILAIIPCVILVRILFTAVIFIVTRI
jgi:hypothetical protein